MAWSNSKIFRPLLADVLGNTSAIDLDSAGDTPKVALYGSGITPDNDVSAANSAFNAGQWVTGGEISQAVQWPTGGIALSGRSLDVSIADTIFYDATDTASGSAATLAAVFGCLVYDDTITTPVADQGISYNYFGGTQSVTNGTFTVVWHANGIWRITL